MLVNDVDVSSDVPITPNPASSKQPAVLTLVSLPLCGDAEEGRGAAGRGGGGGGWGGGFGC